MATDPLFEFLVSLPRWSMGLACLDRIQSYLAQPDMRDPRQSIAPVASALNGNTEVVGLRNRPPGMPPPPFAVKLEEINVSTDLGGSILRNASIVIRPGEVTMLHGSVGCGKTTTLRALLGEVLLRSGAALSATTSYAYAAQKPWFLDASIRVNIIGFKAFDLQRYRRVVAICDLQYDFNRLPQGDHTRVGSGGCHLSGGQQYRIVSHSPDHS